MCRSRTSPDRKRPDGELVGAEAERLSAAPAAFHEPADHPSYLPVDAGPATDARDWAAARFVEGGEQGRDLVASVGFALLVKVEMLDRRDLIDASHGRVRLPGIRQRRAILDMLTGRRG